MAGLSCVKLVQMARSRTDVEVLSQGFRARLWLLGVLIAGALAAAWWSSSREQGIGAPEDRRRLMVVTRGGDINYYAVLERGGFVVEVDSYADWEVAAREQLPDSEAEGAARIVELADQLGFGFVVLESPAELDFSGLELDPPLDQIERLDERDYAVISVGDLGFPNHLSVDAPGEDALLRMPGYGALQAVFAQPAVTARADEDRPTVEELQHEDAIELARWMVERPATFEAAVDYARETIEASLARDAGARTLVGPFETGSAVPTPGGGVLVVHHRLEVYSEDAQTLELHPAKTMQFDWLGPEALARLLDTGELALEPCTSLAGGSIELERRPHLEAAIDGSALSIATAAGEASVWTKLEREGCVWRETARVPALGDVPGILAPRLPLGPASARSGQRMLMAQVGTDEDGIPTVRLWQSPDPRADEARIDERDLDGEGDLDDDAQPIDLLSLPDAKLGALAFVDQDRLALLSRLPLPPERQTTTARADHALHVLDRRRPGAHLRIPAEFFAEDRALRELALLEPAVAADPETSPEGLRYARGPRFALTVTRDGTTELLVLTVGAAAWQAFEDGVLDEGADAGGLFTLTPDDLEPRMLGERSAIAALSVGPEIGGLTYVVADEPQLGEIAFETLADGRSRRLTDNDLIDTLPHFTLDGRHVVFVTMIRTTLAPIPFSVPRIIVVEPVAKN